MNKSYKYKAMGSGKWNNLNVSIGTNSDKKNINDYNIINYKTRVKIKKVKKI